MTYQTWLKYALQWVAVFSLGAATVVSNAAEQHPATRPAIIYKPPLWDAPPARVDGSTRTAGETPILQVLVPEHAGLTTQVQPTLYWYARTPVAARFEFALIDEDGIDPLLEIEAGKEKVTGIQQLDLSEHNISLRPGVAYQWSVVPVTDEGSRSVGIIERMEPGEGLTSRIEKSHGTDLVNVYAIEGIWYDALETISSMIDQSPEDQTEGDQHTEKKRVYPNLSSQI